MIVRTRIDPDMILFPCALVGAEDSHGDNIKEHPMPGKCPECVGLIPKEFFIGQFLDHFTVALEDLFPIYYGRNSPLVQDKDSNEKIEEGIDEEK